MAFLWVWAALFGGGPLVVLIIGLLARLGGSTGNGEPSSVPTPPADLEGFALLVLFPLIAGGVMVTVVRRSRRAGFRLETDGIRGAHDAESTLLPWAQVERLVWRDSEPTSGILVNGRPLPSGPALHAVRHDGGLVRIMQRVARTEQRRASIHAALVEARDAGLLPVPFEADVDHGWAGPGGDAPDARPATTTLWSSDASVGELPPLSDGGPSWPSA